MWLPVWAPPATSEQLKQLQRYTSNFVLALDADAAGQSATIRGLNQARQALGTMPRANRRLWRCPHYAAAGRHSSILSMPEGKDPDEFIRKNPGLASVGQTGKAAGRLLC